MGDYACNVGEKGRVVLVDLYSDGTTLRNSGTQSAKKHLRPILEYPQHNR